MMMMMMMVMMTIMCECSVEHHIYYRKFIARRITRKFPLSLLVNVGWRNDGTL